MDLVVAKKYGKKYVTRLRLVTFLTASAQA